VLLALIPVAIAARPEIQPLLRQAQSTETPARRRALGTLVATQIALAIVLGIGAGLMLRSLWNLQHVNPGFDAPRLLAFRLQTTSKYSSLTTGLPYLERVIERVRALPGVTAVGSIQHLPMTGYNWTTNIYRADQPPPAGTTPPSAVWRFIGWEYFQAMGVPLKAGRLFTAQDHAKSAPIAIVIACFGMLAKARATGASPFAGPARRFAMAFGLPLFSGGALTLALDRSGLGGLLPGTWLLLFGTAVACGGAFSVRIVPVMGFCFMALGVGALIFPSTGDWFMALGFGGLLIGFGLAIARRHGG